MYICLPLSLEFNHPYMPLAQYALVHLYRQPTDQDDAGETLQYDTLFVRIYEAIMFIDYKDDTDQTAELVLL